MADTGENEVSIASGRELSETQHGQKNGEKCLRGFAHTFGISKF
jgi:hypothetical protein